MANNKKPHRSLGFSSANQHSTYRPKGYPRRSHTNRNSNKATETEILGSGLLVENESRELYQRLLIGLISEKNPVGTLEFAFVEKIAINLWRQRRAIEAEAAEISEAAISKAAAIINTTKTEEWDSARQGHGILRNHSNPLVIRKSITYLENCRELLEKTGFQPGIIWRLEYLYGLEEGKFVPTELFRTCVLGSKLASGAQNVESGDLSELKKSALAAFDEEIASLGFFAASFSFCLVERVKAAQQSALVPPSSDRLVRHGKYLGNEFERLLRQLDGLQRKRLRSYSASNLTRL